MNKQNTITLLLAVIGVLTALTQPEFLSALPEWAAPLLVGALAFLQAVVNYLQAGRPGIKAFFLSRTKVEFLPRR